jgi:uncharacterized protein with HEPN domain
MQESIEAIEEYTRGVPLEVFFRDRKLQDAVVRRIEILGEAVRNVPAEVKALHPEIAWKEIAGMRDKLIHDYFGVDLRLVWRVVNQDIPPLREQLQRLLQPASVG